MRYVKSIAMNDNPMLQEIRSTKQFHTSGAIQYGLPLNDKGQDCAVI